MSDELKLVCPECGYVADAAVALAWGDGVQDVPVAPYICAGCGTASIVNLVTRKVEAVFGPRLGGCERAQPDVMGQDP